MAAPDNATEIHRAYTFTSIPKLGPAVEGDALHSLLPQRGGYPGYEYAQWPTDDQRTAEDRGWQDVEGTRSYTIVGPKGAIDCILLCHGVPLHDTDVQSNRRVMSVHQRIFDVTGLSPITGLVPEEVEVDEEVEAAPVVEEPAQELQLTHDPVPEPTHRGKKK